jgi:hypothetical protein
MSTDMLNLLKLDPRHPHAWSIAARARVGTRGDNPASPRGRAPPTIHAAQASSGSSAVRVAARSSILTAAGSSGTSWTKSIDN